MNKLVLIGHRSSGKTVIGRLLSKKLKINFIDLDEFVEKQIGNIDEFVDKSGVEKYRINESKIIENNFKDLSQKLVIAVGGGTIASQFKKLNKKNIKNLKINGKIIYLKLKDNVRSEKILIKREKLRKGNKTLEEIKKLFKIRQKIYGKIYDIQILVNDKEKAQIINEIIKKIK